MKHTLLKIGAFSIATAATAVGSVLLADKSVKKLANGKLADGKTKVRKPEEQINNETEIAPTTKSEKPAYTPAPEVEQNSSPNSESEFKDNFNFTPAPKVEETFEKTQSSEPDFMLNFTPAPNVDGTPEYNPVSAVEQESAEEILPNINLDEVENIITNFEVADDNVAEPEEQKPAYEPQNEDLIGEPQEVDFSMPFIPAPKQTTTNESADTSNDSYSSFNGLPYAAAGSVSQQSEPKFEMPIQPAMPVEPQMPTQPDIGVVPQMPAMPQTPSNPDIQSVPQMPVAPQVDPAVEVPSQNNNYYNDINAEEEIYVSSPVSEEPVVLNPQDVYGEEQLKEPEVISNNIEPEIELTPGPGFVDFNNESKEPTYGQPIFDSPIKVGKTKVIGNSVVSDEPNNKAIEMVVDKFTNVNKNNLVSIMTQDGSGMVFEFSTNFKKNADTLTNVYTTTSNGDVFQPSDAEKLSALNFGRTFINDKKELTEFFN